MDISSQWQVMNYVLDFSTPVKLDHPFAINNARPENMLMFGMLWHYGIHPLNPFVVQRSIEHSLTLVYSTCKSIYLESRKMNAHCLHWNGFVTVLTFWNSDRNLCNCTFIMFEIFIEDTGRLSHCSAKKLYKYSGYFEDCIFSSQVKVVLLTLTLNMTILKPQWTYMHTPTFHENNNIYA